MTASDRTPIVDVDVHLDESAADLAPFCEMPWRRVLVEPTPNVPWTVDGSRYPRLGPRQTPPAPARSPAELRERTAELGIDAAVVLPGPLLKLGVLHTADYAAALARAYNRWLSERWLAEDDGIYGAVLAVPHDPEAAAREIEQHGRSERVVAAVLPTAGVSVLWGDRRYDPIYAAAEAAGLPVMLHGAEKLMVPSTNSQVSQFDSEFDQAVMAETLVAVANVTHIVGTGVLARYPQLRIVFLGAGVSWLGHALMRLDKEYLENRRDVPFYSDRLSLAMKRQIWVGTYPIESTGDPRDLEALIGVWCGIDRVLFGSHWPHAYFDTPARVSGALASDDARRKVLGANALELFGIGLRGAKAVSV